MRRAATIVTGMLLALAPAAARATSLELYGFGDRSAAMGMTGTADARGAASLYYDLGGLPSIEGIQVSAGYQYEPTRLTMDGRSIGARSPRATELMLGFGLSTFRRKSGLALGLHVPDTGLYGVRLRGADQPQFVVVDPRRDRIHVIAGYGIEPVDKLSIGIGASLFADTLGKIAIGMGSQQSGAMDVQLLPTNTLYAGLRGGPFSGVTLGLAYRAQHVARLAFPTTLDAQIANVNGRVALGGTTYAYFTPMQIAGGAAWSNPGWTATADLVYGRWSRMLDPSGTQTIDIADAGGNLPPSPPAIRPVDPGFHDTIAPRLGVERRLGSGARHEWALRAGAAYDPTPAPAPKAGRNLVDCNRTTLTAGAGVTLRQIPGLTGPLSFDAHLGWGRLASRTVMRNDPTDPIGSYTAGGDLWSAGLSMTVGFDATYLRR